MPNPYHDADGKFASRDELNNNIQRALDEGRMDDYIRERKNLDDIEREIAASKDENPDISSTYGTQSFAPQPKNNISHLWESSNDVWENHKERFQDYDSIHRKIIGGQVSPNMASEFDPYKDTDYGRTIPDSTLDIYAAKGTDEGIEMLDHYASFKADMRDTTPLNGTSEEYTIHESSLARAQADSARHHRQMSGYLEEDLKDSSDMESTARRGIRQLREERQESEDNLRKAQFELGYVLTQKPSTDEWRSTETKASELVRSVQLHHDEIIYNHVRERQLKKFL
jgi:hypothetical protein